MRGVAVCDAALCYDNPDAATGECRAGRVGSRGGMWVSGLAGASEAPGGEDGLLMLLGPDPDATEGFAEAEAE